MSGPDAALADALQIALEARHGAPVVVTDLRRLSGGASRQTWAVDAEVGGTPVPLILQRTRGGAAPTGIAVGIEAALLRAARPAGVPVADVVVSAGDDALTSIAADRLAGLGDAWMVLRRVPGEALPARVLRDDAFAAARARMLDDCAAALVAIHRIPPTQVPELEDVDRLVRYREVLDGFGDPQPVFELAIRWLAAHQPTVVASGVVHGDFRTGNLLVDEHGLAAVLDWELAHLGDPAEDLGWFCTRAWRFGSPLPAGGFGTRDELLAAYARAGGAPVDAERLHWWEVMGTLTWGVICMVQTATHRLGLSRSVELAAIGRRVCETELDLLRLLPGPDPAPDHAAPAPTGEANHGSATGQLPPRTVHGLPTAAELVEATREWIEGDVAAATEGAVRFHARVAANVLAMVERELALGPAHAVAHAERLARLGFADDAALAASIRAGDLAGRQDEVATALGAAVLDKLAVAHPGYPDDPA
ncbi:MAG: aminoglycoside phosphotransferase [Acidimicrobiales bacterium]|nr:aminoglycoside phosphotransferase [Acidimicrobiales bacterium]